MSARRVKADASGCGSRGLQQNLTLTKVSDVCGNTLAFLTCVATRLLACLRAGRRFACTLGTQLATEHGLTRMAARASWQGTGLRSSIQIGKVFQWVLQVGFGLPGRRAKSHMITKLDALAHNAMSTSRAYHLLLLPQDVHTCVTIAGAMRFTFGPERKRAAAVACRLELLSHRLTRALQLRQRHG